MPEFDPPVTFHVRERKNPWELAEDFQFTLFVRIGESPTFLIKKGYRFDLSSIPRMFYRIIAPYELTLLAPLIHDYIYEHHGCVTDIHGKAFTFTRKQADYLFLQVMCKRGVPWWRRVVAYVTVRTFGGTFWPEGPCNRPTFT